MPSDSLMQRRVGLHGVLTQTEEIIGRTILDGEGIVIAVEVHVLAAEENLVELGQFLHLRVIVSAIDIAHVLIQRQGCWTVALCGIRRGGVQTVKDDLVALGAVEGLHTEVVAGVAAKSGEGPGGFDGGLSLASVEEHPAVHVTIAVAFIGEFDLALVEDGCEEFGAVTVDVGGQTEVVG